MCYSFTFSLRLKFLKWLLLVFKKNPPRLSLWSSSKHPRQRCEWGDPCPLAPAHPSPPSHAGSRPHTSVQGPARTGWCLGTGAWGCVGPPCLKSCREKGCVCVLGGTRLLPDQYLRIRLHLRSKVGTAQDDQGLPGQQEQRPLRRPRLLAATYWH